MPRPRIHKEGQRFGRLIITKAYACKVNGIWAHESVCDCGNTKTVSGADMRKGNVASCGCLMATHGMRHVAEYNVWGSMIQRCTNKKDSGYKNYGGRGIAVSKEWLSFENFIEDMGRRPSDDLTLERVDNNKGYSADNCIWADRCTQAQNKRIRSDNKTGHMGVSIDHIQNKYMVTIQRGNKRLFLGRFTELGEAIAVRVKAEETFNQTRGI